MSHNAIHPYYGATNLLEKMLEHLKKKKTNYEEIATNLKEIMNLMDECMKKRDCSHKELELLQQSTKTIAETLVKAKILISTSDKNNANPLDNLHDFLQQVKLIMQTEKTFYEGEELQRNIEALRNVVSELKRMTETTSKENVFRKRTELNEHINKIKDLLKFIPSDIDMEQLLHDLKTKQPRSKIAIFGKLFGKLAVATAVLAATILLRRNTSDSKVALDNLQTIAQNSGLDWNEIIREGHRILHSAPFDQF